MKNFKYVTLAALLLSLVVAGCDWNPFRKKPVVTEPPMGNVTAMDNTPTRPDPIRPDPVVKQPPVVVPDDPIPPPPPAGGTTYVIKKGDNLWRIAERYLGNPQRYRDILAANPGLDEKKLPIGQTIKIPPK